MKVGWKSLAWSVVALVLLLSVPTPLSVITLFLVMAPLTVLVTMLRPLEFAVHVIVIGLLAFFLMGNAGPIGLVLIFFFLVPSVAMGWAYKKKASASRALLLGSGFLLAQFLIEFSIFSYEYHYNISGELSRLLSDTFTRLDTNSMLTPEWIAENSNTLSHTFVTQLPFGLILISFLLAIITHGLARWGLRKSSYQTPALAEAKTWKLPRSLVLYFLIAQIVSYVMSSGDEGYWYVAATNLIMILKYVFIIQGIGFFYFLGDNKGWSKPVTAIVAIAYGFLSLLIFPLFLVGLIDTAFPLRRYFVKP